MHNTSLIPTISNSCRTFSHKIMFNPLSNNQKYHIFSRTRTKISHNRKYNAVFCNLMWAALKNLLTSLCNVKFSYLCTQYLLCTLFIHTQIYWSHWCTVIMNNIHFIKIVFKSSFWLNSLVLDNFFFQCKPSQTLQLQLTSKCNKSHWYL